MSCLYRIKANQAHFTNTEKKIATYIIDHKVEVLMMSVQELASAVKTSPAAIIRFSKKVGYSGFSELKLALAQDRSQESPEDFDEVITASDSLKTMIKKVEYENKSTFTKTYKLLNESVFSEAVEKIKNARRVYLVGLGGSGIVCEDLYQKFVRVNLDVVYFQDFHLLMSSLTFASEEDVCIAISYSGETREVVAAQMQAVERKATTIGISQLGASSLSKVTDFMFYVPNEEKSLRLGSMSSRFAMLAITDLMYLELARKNVNDTRKRIIETRRTIEKIR
ncbi:MAG TPA: MurR/RpiR family transcriptional regulator [Erysipelothrix sp.]